MTLRAIHVQKYRSLRSLFVELEQLTVITGPNGSGKSNLYRALWLLSRICEGDFAQSLCREGGFLSALWAGPRLNAKKPVQMTLGFRTEDFGFELICGFPQPSSSRFMYDPEIKEEAVWFGPRRLPSTTLLERSANNAWVRDLEGHRVNYPLILDPNESILSQLREPHRFPELLMLREEVKGWRFYHGFRTDEHALLRRPRVSVRTPALSHDGSDLAAALQTILEVGDADTLFQILKSAFPGRSLEILMNNPDRSGKPPGNAELSVGLRTRGCVRPLEAHELSDGTLKFLCLAAALLSLRPPKLIALNEPEASLHPELLPSLAQLIVNASRNSQLWVCTHSQTLVQHIEQLSGVRPIQLHLLNGETILYDADETAARNETANDTVNDEEE